MPIGKTLCYKWKRIAQDAAQQFSVMEITSRKKIILVGDKVLIAPDAESERTNHGLYLPPGVKEKEKVNSGLVVQVGPGYPVPNPGFLDQDK